MKAVCVKGKASLYASRTESVLHDEMLFGQTADIKAVKNGVCRVETFYGYSGFAERSAFISQGEISDEWHLREKFTVTAPFAAITSLPQAQSRVIANVPRGALLAPSEKPNGSFVELILPNGDRGYAEHLFLRPVHRAQTPAQLRQSICRNALSYLGCQYLWGGKTPMGIDCSGLASISCLMEGIVIYRDAKLINGYTAREIAINRALPGDLIYFPGHIAVYLGDGRFVHSTSFEKTRGVCIASLIPDTADYRPDLHKSICAAASVAP